MFNEHDGINLFKKALDYILSTDPNGQPIKKRSSKKVSILDDVISLREDNKAQQQRAWLKFLKPSDWYPDPVIINADFEDF